MKNKTVILNMFLGALLILSIAGTVILFKQLSNSKQAFLKIQGQLIESKVQLQNTQTDWSNLQLSIEDAKKENVRLVELKNAQAVTAQQSQADPNKKLKSGITLGDAKKMIETDIKRMKATGLSDSDIKEVAEQEAKELGTSLAEIARVPVTQAPVTTTKPSTSTSKPSGGTTQQSSGTQQSGGSQQSGGGKVTEWDKDGDGIPDFLKGHGGSGNGTTTSDPDFHLGTN